MIDVFWFWFDNDVKDGDFRSCINLNCKYDLWYNLCDGMVLRFGLIKWVKC